ncbi:MAG: hypothetical protein B9S33_11885 [Pedosphaera sp. Tous-C6FEB]|nr:MAG: hypothetical protein B9S33_11885 [Pedosphaera sp. Tous-C6FEB]
MKALLALFAFAATAVAADLNTLTDAEKQAGWKLLFDGKSLAGWRTYKEGGKIGAGWIVEDGLLKKQAKIGGGDIMTEQPVSGSADWELAWEWRIAKNGNNGIKYFITEARKGTLGHEYQMLDDDGHPDGKIGPHRQTAAYYDVLPPAKDKPVKPVGEWNASRVVVKGNTVQHWLNGAKVLEYELGSEALKEAVAKSKFKKVEDFGTKVTGHILLTDHGDECSFRNVKLRVTK